MQEEIERLDTRFQRFFIRFTLGWMLVSGSSLLFSLILTFEDHRAYLHQWQGLVITFLSLCVPAAYVFVWLYDKYDRPHKRHTGWPPPLSFSFPFCGLLYLIATLLNLFDTSFVWSYFTVLGMAYSYFQRAYLVSAVLLIFLSYGFFLGLFAWPLIESNWAALAGNGITFLSLTIVSVTIQYLIRERYQRRSLHEQLVQTHRELEIAHQQLALSAEQGQELAVLRERTRLAREMHDILGHALVLISIKLEVAQRMRELDPVRSEQELEATKEIVRTSMNELRASIANLRSPALERESASRALSRSAREMARRADLRISYDLHPAIENLPEAVEETLWKVGQEALTNIEKHAQARNVLLHISRQNGQVFLKIEDDGIGLPSDLCTDQAEYMASYQSPPGHYGLNGMLERVKNSNGRLHIQSNGRQGTRIEVSLPLVEEPSLPSTPQQPLLLSE